MKEKLKADVIQRGQTGADLSDQLPERRDVSLGLHSQPAVPLTPSRLRGKRVAMVAFPPYPTEPRTRRSVDAFLEEGMRVDLICRGKSDSSECAPVEGLDIVRCPLVHRRDSKLAYIYNYSAFTIFCTVLIAVRSLKRRYDLVYIHNMPDILALCGLIPKALGSKVVFDIHDPMPELMMTIFNLAKDSLSVRLIGWIEKWSIACAHKVVTANTAFKRVFGLRSGLTEKIDVVMNSPDEQIFPLRRPRPDSPSNGVPAKRFVIMYHGSIVKRNGVDLAVDAFACISQIVPAAELRIYGAKTPFLESVMDAARRKGLEGRVHFMGIKRLEDLVQEIEKCDVGIVPNQRNAFTDINMPTRIFEYLRMGKPAIAPRTPGVQDYFTSESLIFFEPGNVEDLARKIEHVAFHYQQAVSTAELGQKVYLSHAWCHERQALVNLVDRLLNGGEGAAVSEGRMQREHDKFSVAAPGGRMSAR